VVDRVRVNGLDDRDVVDDLRGVGEQFRIDPPPGLPASLELVS
jgi:hypothetical protein